MQGKTVAGFDKLVNFTEVIVSTGYDASATSVVLQAGEGVKLPEPSVYGSYYGVWHDVTAQTLASGDANREWILINSLSSDTLTSITRAQQETSASTKNEVGHQYRISIVLSAAQMEKYNNLQNAGISRQAAVNSNFNVWSAGTSFSDPANNSETSDKWKAGFILATGTFPTVVHSRQALTPGDVLGSFYNYRINTNGAGTSLASTENYKIYQDIVNGTRFLAGASKKITVSFYAKSSIASKKIGVNVIQNYGTGGSPTADETITGDNVTLTSSWVFYSFTYTLNTIVGKTFGTNNDDYLRLQLWDMWQSGTQSQVGASSTESFGGSGNVEFTQVQVCSGDVALEYKQEDLTDESLRILGISNLVLEGETTVTNSASKVLKTTSSGYTDNSVVPYMPAFTIGETVSIRDALATFEGIELINLAGAETNVTACYGGSGSDSVQKTAQTFTVPETCTVSAITTRLAKVLAPTDDLIIRIETTSAGLPTGTLIHANATITVLASSLTTSLAEYTLSFAGTFSLSSGTTYAVVLQRSGSRDTSNYFTKGYCASGGYTDGNACSYGSGFVWTNDTPADFKLLKLVTGYIAKANGSAIYKNKFIGFADRAGVLNDVVYGVSNGMLTGFTGLTPKSVYVLGNTDGSIKVGTTPYTSEVIVGYAINSTTLLVKPLDFIKLL